MSSFEPARTCRPAGHIARTAFFAIAALGLAGCGFSPLYANRLAPGSVATEFSQIEIAPIHGRVGLQLRNNLVDRFSARSAGEPTRYRLDIQLREQKEGLAIQQDESVTRFNYRLSGDISLVQKDGNKLVFSDTARSSAAFNVVQSEFATLSAERDAEDRAARDLSSEIVTRIALYFRRAGEDQGR